MFGSLPVVGKSHADLLKNSLSIPGIFPAMQLEMKLAKL